MTVLMDLKLVVGIREEQKVRKYEYNEKKR